MKRYCLALACCLAAIVAVSCKKKAETGEPPIALVSYIIENRNLPSHKLVASYSGNDASKSVFLVGSPVLCEAMRQKLLEVDAHDNIDGRLSPDGLPDFAGELVCTVVDFANAPYSAHAGREEALREVAVRDMLVTMDTLCFINEYDRSGVASKPLPKLVVMASPYAAAYGKYDIDTLFKSLGCRLPVVYPLETMLDGVFAKKAGSLNIGFITGEESLDSTACEALLKGKAEADKRSGCTGVVFASDLSAPDPLLSFLDSCLLAGKVRPLDAIIVDDPFADAVGMRMTLGRITNPDNPESLSYGKLIAPGCMIIEICESVSDECYRILRKGNLFTHNISLPRSLEFKTAMLSDSTFVLTPFDNGDPLR